MAPAGADALKARLEALRQRISDSRLRDEPAWWPVVTVCVLSLILGLTMPHNAMFGISGLGVIGGLLGMAYVWAERPARKGLLREIARLETAAADRMKDQPQKPPFFSESQNRQAQEGPSILDAVQSPGEPYPKHVSLFKGPSHPLFEGGPDRRWQVTLGIIQDEAVLPGDTLGLLGLFFQTKTDPRYSIPVRIASHPSGGVIETVDLLMYPDGTAEMRYERDNTDGMRYVLLRPVNTAALEDDTVLKDGLTDCLIWETEWFTAAYCECVDPVIQGAAKRLQPIEPLCRRMESCAESLTHLRIDHLPRVRTELDRYNNELRERYAAGGPLADRGPFLYEKNSSTQQVTERLTVSLHPRPDAGASRQQHWYAVRYCVAAADRSTERQFERKTRLGGFRQEQAADWMAELNNWLDQCRGVIYQESMPGQLEQIRDLAGRLTGGSLALSEDDLETGLRDLIAADQAYYADYLQSPPETQAGVETEGCPSEEILSVSCGPDQTATLRCCSTGVYALAFEVFRWPRTPSDSGSVELVRVDELPRDFPRGWTPERFARRACSTEETRRACAADPKVIRFFQAAEKAGQAG